MDRAIDGALAGSNVIRGYTDQGLPTDPNGMHFPQMRRGGNVFTDWGGGPGGHAGARRYREMITEGVNRESTAPRLPGAEAGSGTFDQMWSNRIGTLGGAGAALRSGGSPVTNNSRSSETNIGNMNVTVPPGADPAGYARGISQELERYDNVMNANEGLL